MPVELVGWPPIFISDEQTPGFVRFPAEVARENLEHFCWLNDTGPPVAIRRPGIHNPLGFAPQLATDRLTDARQNLSIGYFTFSVPPQGEWQRTSLARSAFSKA